MVLAILTMSNVIDYSFNHFPLPTTLFFVGLVTGGIPLLTKKVSGTKELKKPSSYVIASLTFALVLLLALSEQLFNINLYVRCVHFILLSHISKKQNHY